MAKTFCVNRSHIWGDRKKIQCESTTFQHKRQSLINFCTFSKYGWTKHKNTIRVSIEWWTTLWQLLSFNNLYSAREPAVWGKLHSLFMICRHNGCPGLHTLGRFSWPVGWVFSGCVASCCCDNAVLQLCTRRTSGSSADLKARRAARQINRSSSLWTQTPEVPLTMNISRAVLRWRHRSKNKTKTFPYVCNTKSILSGFYNLSSLKNMWQAINSSVFQLGFSISCIQHKIVGVGVNVSTKKLWIFRQRSIQTSASQVFSV